MNMPMKKTPSQKIPAIDACRADLFSQDLESKYPDSMVRKILRCREMYLWMIQNPSERDRKFVEIDTSRHDITRQSAYDDLRIVKALLPDISTARKDFHRWRYNEMILETYNNAKLRKDVRTMERAATSYARYNRIDMDDEDKILPFDLIAVQPFTATEDPSVLGLTPIPDADRLIKSLIEKYRKESADIEDIEFEEVDLEEDELYGTETNLLQ